MATSYNTTITVYAGVPLVKNGTDVLFVGGATAKGVLASKAVGTYSGYYFERENRRYVQIDETYGNLDNVNYLCFENQSHGGKLYFAFVDRVVYINDNNTELEFTIDPFPTFIDDGVKASEVYVRRNTPKIITRNMPYFFTDDYQLPSCKYEFQPIAALSYQATTAMVYFASVNVAGSGTITGAGIKTGGLTGALINDIQTNGGVIIGAYAVPSGWADGTVQITDVLPDVTVGNPFVGISCNNDKIKTGVYARLAVTGNSETKYYNIEEFSNPEAIVFGMNRLMLPGPSVFIYPKNYKGLAVNLAEGILCKFPAIPITANAVYTTQQRYTEIAETIKGGISGIAGGYIGVLLGAATPAIKGAYEEYIGNSFKPPMVIGHGEPIIDGTFTMRIGFNTIQPSDRNVNMIDDYLTRFGWAVDGVLARNLISYSNDKDYLQTGEPFILGCEESDAINARIMSGIRIRTQLP